MRSFMQTMKRPQSWSLIIAQAGVTLDRPAAAILFLLTHHEPTQFRLHEIAERLGIEAPSVTRKIQQLEQAGLVARQQDAQDKRAYSLCITVAGRRIAKQLRTAQRQILMKALSDWPKSERQQFVKLFEQFSDSIGRYYTKPIDPGKTKVTP